MAPLLTPPEAMMASLAVHSRSVVPSPSTSKPDAQSAGEPAQLGSNRAPVGYASLLGPLEARSHWSSVQRRAPLSAHRAADSARVRLVNAATWGSLGNGNRSIENGPSSTEVSRWSSCGWRPSVPGSVPASNVPVGISTRSLANGTCLGCRLFVVSPDAGGADVPMVP